MTTAPKIATPQLSPASVCTGRSHKLHVPIKIGGRLFKKLHFDRITGIEAFIAARGTSLDTAIRGIALSAKVPQDVVERLGPRDFTRACELMSELHPEIDHNV